MLIDFEAWDGGPDIHCDVCVLGAGAAGITIARSLSGSGTDVCLVEGGGLEPDEASQALYEGESVGQQLASPSYCRLRYFGGTTNHWQGMCAALEACDFAARPWVPWSGWPIGQADLADYYRQAARLCQLEQPADLAEGLPSLLGLLAGNGFEPAFWRFSPPTRFGQVYRDELASAEHVRVLMRANVCRIESDPSATAVRAVHVKSLSGRGARVAARVFVLACGGLENPRLLLLSDDVAHGGLGNGAGLVGRFFMQHIEAPVARVLAPDPRKLARAFERRSYAGVDARPHLRLSLSTQARRRMLNCGVAVSGVSQYSDGYRALRDLWRQARSWEWPDDLADQVWALVADLDGAAGDLFRPGRIPVALNISGYGEQAPNPDSRVQLSSRRDRFGLRQVRVDWQLSEIDRHSLGVAARSLAEEIGRRGLGRVQLVDWLRQDAEAWPARVWSGCHHMGTTRMADDPRQGVVDRHCRVHFIRNLYVAGSSVFPTGGYVPPTLTIVALALRLADRLKGELSEVRS